MAYIAQNIECGLCVATRGTEVTRAAEVTRTAEVSRGAEVELDSDRIPD